MILLWTSIFSRQGFRGILFKIHMGGVLLDWLCVEANHQTHFVRLTEQNNVQSTIIGFTCKFLSRTYGLAGIGSVSGTSLGNGRNRLCNPWENLGNRFHCMVERSSKQLNMVRLHDLRHTLCPRTLTFWLDHNDYRDHEEWEEAVELVRICPLCKKREARRRWPSRLNHQSSSCICGLVHRSNPLGTPRLHTKEDVEWALEEDLDALPRRSPGWVPQRSTLPARIPLACMYMIITSFQLEA